MLLQCWIGILFADEMFLILDLVVMASILAIVGTQSEFGEDAHVCNHWRPIFTLVDIDENAE